MRKTREVPDRVKEYFAKYIKEDLNNGDWTASPWFLKEDAKIFTMSGRTFSQDEKEIAFRELKKLYPTEVCRELLNPEHFFEIVMGLFVYVVPWFVTLQLLGLDLSVTQPWNKPNLIKRLRNPDEYLGARLELEVWASLRRHGLDVAYSPDTSGSKNPDLQVVWNYRIYYIEVKSLRKSDADKLGYQLDQELSFQLIKHGIPDDGCEIHIKDELSSLVLSKDGRKIILSQKKDMFASIETAYKQFKEAGYPLGEHKIENIGVIKAPSRFGSRSLSSNLFQETTPEQESSRAYRLFHEAAGQLPAEGVGLVFLDVSSKTDVDDLATHITAESKIKGPRFSNVDLIVFRYHDRNARTAALIPVSGVRNLPWHKLSKKDQQLAFILSEGKSME